MWCKGRYCHRRGRVVVYPKSHALLGEQSWGIQVCHLSTKEWGEGERGGHQVLWRIASLHVAHPELHILHM